MAAFGNQRTDPGRVCARFQRHPRTSRLNGQEPAQIQGVEFELAFFDDLAGCLSHSTAQCDRLNRVQWLLLE
jgi:hypothetical protein